jgi:hypothetical protein
VIETSALAAVLLVSIAAPPPEALELVEQSNDARERGDFEAALDAMRRAYDLDPAPELANNLAFLFERLGRYVEASQACRWVIESGAPEVLKAKNRDRLAALASRLEAAPVVLRASPSSTVHLGELDSDVDGEQLTTPGRALIQIVDRDHREVALRRILLPAGRQTVVTAEIDRTGFGSVRLEDPTDRVIVDGETIREPRFLLLLEPGPHDIETDRSRFQITVASGDSIALAAPIAPPPPPVPEPAPTSTGWWCYLLWGAGGAFAITGGALVGSAYADIARIDDGSPISRVTYDEALELDRSAAIKSPIGIGFLVAGGVSLIAGTTWWLIED